LREVTNVSLKMQVNKIVFSEYLKRRVYKNFYTSLDSQDYYEQWIGMERVVAYFAPIPQNFLRRTDKYAEIE
jgi:hypothetical protein